MVSKFPARIHVLLASKARVGLVIRRGPSKSVATLLWDLETDRFKLGQWLRGRIYERRSDLSPDGKYFLYFAMNGRWNGEAGGSWSAISKAPYLKAISFFPKGDCWFGGGLFTGERTFWLNGEEGHSKSFESYAVSIDREWKPRGSFGGECPGVYYWRLLRDGWRVVDQPAKAARKNIDLFEKQCPNGWVLRKIAHSQMRSPVGRGCYWDEHALIRSVAGVSTEFPKWEWAELDNGRLIWATEGRIECAALGRKGLEGIKVLKDLNNLEFQPIAAPY